MTVFEKHNLIENARNLDLYAMYLRKSRADLEAEALGEGETLARHKAMLFKLAERMGIFPNQIVIYQEIVSGDSISDRPEVQRLLTDVYMKKYKGILVAEVERLARGNTKDQGEVADAFIYSETKIITPAKVYDPNNESDQEYFEFGLFMSRREYKTIRRRLEAGKRQSVAEGNYIAKPRPFGYEIIRPSRKVRTLKILPEEAQYVQMIFDWWTKDRRTSGWIARELTSMQIRTASGSLEWNRSSIMDLIKNHTYAGWVRWDSRTIEKEYDPVTRTVVERRRRKKSHDVPVWPGKHKAIISQEQFDFAQTLFVNSLPAQLDKGIVFPLAGLVKCADCGKGMYHQGFTSRPNTKAIVSHVTTTPCKKKSCPVDVVIDAVTNSLKAYIADFEIKMNNEHQAKEERQRHNQTIEAMNEELAKINKRKQNMFDSWEAQDGTYTKEEFIERKQMYSRIIEELQEKIKEAKKSVPEPVDYSEKITTLHKMIDCLNDPEMDVVAKNNFLKDNIEVIKYDVIDHGRNKGATPVLDVILK